jgi:hypothetical protein
MIKILTIKKVLRVIKKVFTNIEKYGNIINEVQQSFQHRAIQSSLSLCLFVILPKLSAVLFFLNYIIDRKYRLKRRTDIRCGAKAQYISLILAEYYCNIK